MHPRRRWCSMCGVGVCWRGEQMRAPLRRGALLGALAAVLVLLVSAASASAFSAHGSVEQVYATGLPAGAEVSLLGPNGETLATQNADALGGVLYRHI